MSDAGAIPDDTEDTAPDDAGSDQNQQSGDDAILRVMNYGRQKYGLPPIDSDGSQSTSKPQGAIDESGVQETGYIPTIPAGPGGDKPGDPTPKGRPQPGNKVRAMSFDAGGPVEDDSATAAIPEPAEQGEADPVAAAIPEQGDNGTSGAAPASEDASAVAPIPGKGGTGLNDRPEGSEQAGPIGGALQSGAKRLFGYLTGGAAPEQQVKQVEQAAEQANGSPMAEGEKKVAAIKYALATGGDEAALGVLQSYRQKYELLRQAAAATTANDPNRATQLATQAYDHLPNGVDVHFINGQGNTVTATVTSGDKVLAKVPMTTQQFHDFVRSPSQQFDAAMNSTPAVDIQQALGAQAQAPAQDGAQPAQGGGKQGGTPIEYGDVETINKRARELFPLVSQGPQRSQWVAQQLEKGQQYGSQERQASEKGKALTERAKIGADSRGRVQELRNEGQMGVAGVRADSYDKRTDQMGTIAEGRNQTTRDVQAGHDQTRLNSSFAGNPLATPEGFKRTTGQTPQEAISAAGQPRGGSGAPQAQTPGAQRSVPAQPQQNIPQVGQVVKGFRYKGGPPGSRTSWEPAQ